MPFFWTFAPSSKVAWLVKMGQHSLDMSTAMGTLPGVSLQGQGMTIDSLKTATNSVRFSRASRMTRVTHAKAFWHHGRDRLEATKDRSSEAASDSLIIVCMCSFYPVYIFLLLYNRPGHVPSIFEDIRRKNRCSVDYLRLFVSYIYIMLYNNNI
jgi:hypothetical protein